MHQGASVLTFLTTSWRAWSVTADVWHWSSRGWQSKFCILNTWCTWLSNRPTRGDYGALIFHPLHPSLWNTHHQVLGITAQHQQDDINSWVFQRSRNIPEAGHVAPQLQTDGLQWIRKKKQGLRSPLLQSQEFALLLKTAQGLGLTVNHSMDS